MYFGQQNITAVAPADGVGTEANPITSPTQMDAITYTVNADPAAVGGTWLAGSTTNSAYNRFGGTHMDSLLGPTIIGYNYPINVYPAGNYGYTVSAQNSSRADATPVPVNYPAGLGTSVSANFTTGSAASLSVTMANGTPETLSFGASNTNGPLKNGVTGSVDTNVFFNNAVKTTGTNGQSSIANSSTITLTENSTRPQSVWYTVSASGKGTDTNPITQTGYELTQAEKDNIFAINTGKIAGATNTGLGGYGYGMGNDINSSSSLNTSKTYTTTTCGNQNGVVNNNINTTYGQPFAALNTSLKTGAPEGQNTITLSQNYLPLGITSAVKDAYFNHNGII